MNVELRGVRPKASDIDEVELLRNIEMWCRANEMWGMTSPLRRQFYPALPEAVLLAKLRRLLARGLVTGCGCGCRGDWELTSKGRERAGIKGKYRDNPMEGI